MPAVPLARLQGASALQVVEGSCRGVAKGLEINAAAALVGGIGYSDSLALSSS